MINWLQSLPTYSAYGSPSYFIYLLIALIPLMIGLYFGKRFSWYEFLISFGFIFVMFTGANIPQGVALIGYLVYETLLVMSYFKYRQIKNQTSVFYGAVFLSILPLVIVKLTPAMVGHSSLLGFMGISYLTFRATGTIIETRDGMIKELKWWELIRFMSFMPTITSGPIDRYRRFAKDYQTVPSREEYLTMINQALYYLFLGFLYKFVITYFFAVKWQPAMERLAMMHAPHFSWPVVGVAYMYAGNLFFDFAGYSLFAVGISYLMGVKTPMNFKRPFASPNIKEFWNRWHITLSFWFRDFIFMRFVFLATKKRWFKNRNALSSTAYMLNMMIMGFWHGITWYYILYGFLHGLALVVNDAWLRFKRKHWPKHKPNWFTNAIAIFITFNFVVFTFLIFSGFLDKFFFHHQ